MILTRTNKRALGFLLTAVGLFLLLLFVYSKKSSVYNVVEETYEAPEVDELHEVAESSNSNDIVKTSKKEDKVSRKPSSLKVSSQKFKERSKEILELAKNFPENKSKLIAVVSSKDAFKENNNQPKPHTVDDIIQQQQGALRVLALRLLMENEAKDELKSDLASIIKEAQDPTMSKIAKEALKSVEAGRPFFEDLPDAINRL